MNVSRETHPIGGISTVGTDGSFKEAHWFDEQRLFVIAEYDTIVLDNSRTPGPDKPAPKR